MTVLVKKFRFEKLEFLMFVLDEMADEMAKKGRSIIKLTLGKPQEPLHKDIVNAYIRAIKDPEKRNLVYPQGLPALRKAIAKWYTNMGNDSNFENIVINTGTSPLFKDLFRFLLGEGDEVLLPRPFYSVYHVSALLTQAKIRFYSIDKNTLKVNVEEIRRKYNPKKTKIIVIASPGNPFGNILSEENMKYICELVSDRTYILSDEIYRNTGFHGRVPSILDVAKKEENIIVSNSFSKGFRMYTSRVGYLRLPNHLVNPFRVLLQHTLLTVSPAPQFAALEALNHLDEVERLTSIYSKRNQFIFEKLDRIEGVEVIKAEGGFYCVLICEGFMKRLKIEDTFNLAKDILQKTGVAVVPGSDFGLNNGIRISFTNRRFTIGVDRLEKYFLNS